jgi:hypothetical protein
VRESRKREEIIKGKKQFVEKKTATEKYYFEGEVGENIILKGKWGKHGFPW